MHLITIILFFIYLYGLGASVTRFLRDHTFENFIFRLGVGLGMIPVVGIILNLLHIPLDWRVFLALSLAGPIIDLYLRRKEISISHFHFPQLRWPVLAVIALFLAFLAVNCIGPFSYTWLEDDDSWAHAAGIKYIAVEKDVNAPSGIFQYLNPYPPGYELVFAILHQTDPSIYWTLKFFNGLIVALSLLFFYIFAKAFIADDRRAILAALFLAIIPCYLTHFIWAHSMVMALFFPALYALYKIDKDKRFILPGCIVIAAILLTQPTKGIKFVILVILFLTVRAIVYKKLPYREILTLTLAAIISLTWWGPVFCNMQKHSTKIVLQMGNDQSQRSKQFSELKGDLFSPTGGSATRSYTFKDYVGLPTFNLINNPVGMGLFMFILFLLGIFCSLHKVIYGSKEEITAHGTLLLWLIFTFLGMNTETFHLPVGLFAFRFWMLFAIPVVILVAEATFQIFKILKLPATKVVIAILLILTIGGESGYHKIQYNMTWWPWGIYWTSFREVMGYTWMRLNLPPNTKIFAFIDNFYVIGHDMHADFWTTEYQTTFSNAISMPPAELNAALKKNHFEYIIFGGREVRQFGKEFMNKKFTEIYNSHLFQYISGTKEGVAIFKVL